MKNEYTTLVNKGTFEVLSVVARHRETLSRLLRYQRLVVNEPNMKQGDKLKIIHNDKSIDATVSDVEMDYVGNWMATIYI